MQYKTKQFLSIQNKTLQNETKNTVQNITKQFNTNKQNKTIQYNKTQNITKK